jgi:hypothetical protein
MADSPTKPCVSLVVLGTAGFSATQVGTLAARSLLMPEDVYAPQGYNLVVTWPQKHLYAISNRIETLREWSLRTWSQPALDSTNNRLVRCKRLV